jgi:hypothetical protein
MRMIDWKSRARNDPNDLTIRRQAIQICEVACMMYVRGRGCRRRHSRRQRDGRLIGSFSQGTERNKAVVFLGKS